MSDSHKPPSPYIGPILYKSTGVSEQYDWLLKQRLIVYVVGSNGVKTFSCESN
jgi:hypothetical protein